MKRITKMVALVAVAILGSCVISNGSMAENLLKSNPDFEEGTKGWGTFVPGESKGANCRFTVSESGSHGGKGSAKMESDSFARYSISNGLSVRQGQRLRITAWIKGDANAEAKSGTPGFLLRVLLQAGGKDVRSGLAFFVGLNGKTTLQSPGEGLNLEELVAPLPREWAKIETVIEIPKNIEGATEPVDKAGIGCFAWYAKGAIYVDDVSVEEVGAEVPLTPLVKVGGSNNRDVKTGPVTTEEEALAALNLNAPGMEKVKAAAQRKDMAAVKDAYLEYRRSSSNPARWKVMPSDMPKSPSAKSDEAGDEVVRHFIRNMYGFEPKSGDMGKEFNWLYNPIPPTNPGFSKEWTWCVISRTQFWRILGEAYWKTHDEKYAKEWVDQFTDFVAKNPLKKGSDLWRTLDSAIRMEFAWPDTYFRLLNSPHFTAETQWLYLRAIYDHVNLLRDGLKNPNRSGNWVSTECLGLYTIGSHFQELNDAADLRKLAVDRLTAEIDRMVPPDGYEAELTPNYHMVALGGYVGVLELAHLNNLPVPENFKSKVLKMYQAMVMIMDQSGDLVPTNDSGVYNARAIARKGLKLFKDDPMLKWAASEGSEGTPLPTSTMLPYAGMYTMRGGWDRQDLFLFFRAGPTGMAHENEDMLQIALKAYGRMLLFDPGNHLYDCSDFRRYVRNTSSHNTIIVDGKWQHRGMSQIPVTEPMKNPWTVTPGFDFVSGTYDQGYQQCEYVFKQYAPEKWVGEVDKSVSHTRRIIFLKPYYALILDTLDGSGQHTIDAHFHTRANDVKVDPSTLAAVTQSDEDIHLAMYPLDRANLAVDVVKGQKDPLLGWANVNTPAPTVRFRKKQEAPALFATFLYPYKGEAPKFVASPLEAKGKDIWGQSIQTPFETAELVLSKNNQPADISFASSSNGEVKAKAALVILRKSPEGLLSSGREISSYQDKQVAFAIASPASLSWTEKDGKLQFFNAEEKPCEVTFTAPFARKVILSAGVWNDISKGGASASSKKPSFFVPIAKLHKSDVATYADYLKKYSAGELADPTPIVVEAENFTLPAGAVVKADRTGASGKALCNWDATGSVASLKVSLPKDGWYRLKLRYASEASPARTLLIDGKIPFAEAEAFSLPTTGGWGYKTADWAEHVLGSNQTAGGWKIYLKKGSSTLSFRQEGGGCNVDLIELTPLRKG